MRAALDPNVLIAALLSPRGSPAELLRRWLNGEYELVVATTLLAELARALAYPKVRRRGTEADAVAFVDLLRRSASLMNDPRDRPRVSRDPGDDYLVALARSAAAILVTGDEDLLALESTAVLSPRVFLARLG